MEDIKVLSTIDEKTFFNIGILNYFGTRTLILSLVAFAAMQLSIIGDPFSWYNELMIAGIMIFLFFIFFPLSIYIKTKAAMKKTAYLQEAKLYTINADTIAYKGETISASSGWKDISKMVEREKYFLLKVSVRGVHYLPKDGFESVEEIERFKNLLRGKRIKMTYR
jgi:hypothetical protein